MQESGGQRDFYIVETPAAKGPCRQLWGKQHSTPAANVICFSHNEIAA